MVGMKGGVRTPSGAVGTSQAATTPKIRDSCQACAMSKVKCPKEKPKCSRCESRSISCQYAFTRRPGRRRQPDRQPNEGKSTKSSSSFGTEHGQTQALQSSIGACLLSPSTTPCGSNNGYLEMSPQSSSIPATPLPDYLLAREDSDEIHGLGEANMFSSLGTFDYNGDDMNFIMSAMDSPFGTPALDNGGLSQAHNDIESLLIPPHGIDVDLQASDMSSTISAPSKITTCAPDIQAMANAGFEVTQLIERTNCGCLTQSIDLLKTLSAQSDSQPCPSTSETQEAAIIFADGFCHLVLTENKLFIEAVSETLACRCCSEDSFLLAVLSMTVLKVLERYAAAARGHPNWAKKGDLEAKNSSKLVRRILDSTDNTKDQITVLSRTYDTSHNRGRKAAQLVLSELHRVQRLVNQLSSKLREFKGGIYETPIDPELWGCQGIAQDWDRGPAAPFSATTLGQMESDVRKCLSALSSEIINGLKQG